MSLMLTFWRGGGSPHDSRTMTFGAYTDLSELLTNAIRWAAKQAESLEPVSDDEDEPEEEE